MQLLVLHSKDLSVLGALLQYDEYSYIVQVCDANEVDSSNAAKYIKEKMLSQ